MSQLSEAYEHKVCSCIVDSTSFLKIFLGAGGMQCMLHVSRCLWQPDENIGFPGCGVTSSCKLPGVGAQPLSSSRALNAPTLTGPSLQSLSLLSQGSITAGT